MTYSVQLMKPLIGQGFRNNCIDWRVYPVHTGHWLTMRRVASTVFGRLSVIIGLLFFLGGLVLTEQVSALTLEEKRDLYKKARKELRAGRIDSFNSIGKQLEDYPLYPYLIYDKINRNLWKTKTKDIVRFLNDYDDLPIAGDLRTSWLNYLAKRKKWTTFVDNYRPQSDEVLKCHYLHARLMTKRQANLLEDTRDMWLVGSSRPPQCDKAFELLYKSDLMTDELIWQRIGLAMDEGQSRLARYLGKKLDAKDRDWVRRWMAMHNNPWAGTSKPKYKDEIMARKLLIYGIYRLAARDTKKALTRWPVLKAAYKFDAEQILKIEKRLATLAAKYDHGDPRSILDQIPHEAIDENIFHWHIATALKYQDWDLLLKWTRLEPAMDSIAQRRHYWHARALEETGDPEAADAIYQKLAEGRDYFSFSAADRLGQDYAMGQRSLPVDVEARQKVATTPAVERARELFFLGMLHSARREWQHSFKSFSNYQLQIASAIAAEWGWHDRVILTLGKARAYDDLLLRFPLAYKKELTAHAKKRNLDLAWVYALTRSESAFIEDVRSPAGALGLMQVMPRTGRETARKLGMKSYKRENLKQSAKNISIGTTYLRKMYDRFDNNIILATAAYNAGPANVSKWLPKKGCVEPDIWIAQIPFTETRKYVRRILYIASIYDWRLKNKIKSVQERVAMVSSRKTQNIAGFSCTKPVVSMN